MRSLILCFLAITLWTQASFARTNIMCSLPDRDLIVTIDIEEETRPLAQVEVKVRLLEHTFSTHSTANFQQSFSYPGPIYFEGYFVPLFSEDERESEHVSFFFQVSRREKSLMGEAKMKSLRLLGSDATVILQCRRNEL